MKVNLFWRGDNFDEFNRICLLSHLKVGHEVVMWLSGSAPKNHIWDDIKDKITILNANTVFDVTGFLIDGGNFQTASDLWRFNFLYDYGGWYSDTDAFAIQHFHRNEEWVVCSSETDNRLSIGIIKAPEKHPIFLDCIDNIKHKWGNVDVFSNAYKKHFGNTLPTVPNIEYYPWKWNKWDTIYDDIKIGDLMNVNIRSIHLYGTMLKRNNVTCCLSSKQCILNEMINYVL